MAKKADTKRAQGISTILTIAEMSNGLKNAETAVKASKEAIRERADKFIALYSDDQEAMLQTLNTTFQQMDDAGVFGTGGSPDLNKAKKFRKLRAARFFHRAYSAAFPDWEMTGSATFIIKPAQPEIELSKEDKLTEFCEEFGGDLLFQQACLKAYEELTKRNEAIQAAVQAEINSRLEQEEELHMKEKFNQAILAGKALGMEKAECVKRFNTANGTDYK